MWDQDLPPRAFPPPLEERDRTQSFPGAGPGGGGRGVPTDRPWSRLHQERGERGGSREGEEMKPTHALLEHMQSAKDVRFAVTPNTSGRGSRRLGHSGSMRSFLSANGGGEGESLSPPLTQEQQEGQLSGRLQESSKKIMEYLFPPYAPQSEVIASNTPDPWYPPHEPPTTPTAVPSSPPDSSLPRKVYLHNREENAKHEYVGNGVSTTKYTSWNFVPLFLVSRFRQTANAYFFLVGVGQLIPAISPTGGIPFMWLSLAFVLALDGFFEGVADHKRYKADKKANSAPTLRYDEQTESFVHTTWSEVVVGDILMVKNRETIPADLLLVGVSEKEDEPPQGICFVETKSLDGETNLKIREVMPLSSSPVSSPKDVREARGLVECEGPNHNTNSFRGKWVDENGARELSIDRKNVLLRGTTLRNVDHIYGLVLNTGPDTKIMQSSKPNPHKYGQIAEVVNSAMLYLVIILVVLCLAGGLLCSVWIGVNIDEHTYLLLQESGSPTPFYNNFAGFLIYTFYFWGLTSSIIPITLYVTLAITKTWQAWFINKDIKMYYEPTDTPALARNPDLNDLCGQISFIFSDKTGTLTANVMDFRKCSINGVAYGKGTTEIGRVALKRAGLELSGRDVIADNMLVEQPSNVHFVDPTGELAKDRQGARGKEHAQKIERFLLHLAVCHNVIPEHPEQQEGEEQESPTSPPEILWSASSPDEQALVAGAAYLGYKFVDRRPGAIFLETAHGIVQVNVLDIIDFNSSRKRMSTIVRLDNGELMLFCKGADSVILERLSKEGRDEELVQTTMRDLDRFAMDGLRTLLIACKPLSEEEYAAWAVRYHQSLTNHKEREKMKDGLPNRIEQLEEEIETGLTLLGATAIEDRLQDGVPATIADLLKAGIKVWVLTGDKEETAINIGFACQLLSNDMERVVLSSHLYPDPYALRKVLRKNADEMTQYWAENAGKNPKERTPLPEKALIIDGATLSLVFEDEYLQQLLVELAQHCVAVVGCRVSPKQKALMVLLIKKYLPTVRTLAIGDGANDVSMIQEAHVGVGISGREGTEAVNNSDFAIAQFSFLSRLLLVHGHWNYHRVSKACLYIVYKNIIFQWVTYVLAIYAALSGTLYHNQIWINLYNIVYTAVPIVVVSILDQSVPERMAARYPALYRTGWKNELFGRRIFWQWILEAFFQGTICALIPLWFYGGVDKNGMFYSIYRCGAVSWTAMMIVSHLKLVLNTATFDILFLGSVFLSIIVYFASLLIWNVLEIPAIMDWAFPYEYSIPNFWVLVFVTCVLAMAREIFWKGWKYEFYPEYYHLLREAHVHNIEGPALDWNPALEQTTFFVAGREEEEAGEPDLEKAEETASQQEGRRRHTGFAFSVAEEGQALLKKVIQMPVELMIPAARRKRDRKFAQFIDSLPLENREIWENERRSPLLGYGSSYPGHMFPTDPLRFSHGWDFDVSAFEFPLEGWVVDTSLEGSDENGWIYDGTFSALRRRGREERGSTQDSNRSGSERRGLRLGRIIEIPLGRSSCRRRRWIPANRSTTQQGAGERTEETPRPPPKPGVERIDEDEEAKEE